MNYGDDRNWFAQRSFEDYCAELDTRGYVIIDAVLGSETVEALTQALQPHLLSDRRGRNDFEGARSNRVYALLAKDPLFAELVVHPLALRFAEHELGSSCLLSACLAINLLPGESPQPWHFDDAHIWMPRPRQATGISTFWALGDTTASNGATEVLPGSHLWGDERFAGASSQADFEPNILEKKVDTGARPDTVLATMTRGSLMIAKSTLWHRGGANRSGQPRLIITPQYCAGWVRQLENMLLAVPPERAALLPQRTRELLGYSIHPPFMGFVDGRHPQHTLPEIR